MDHQRRFTYGSVPRLSHRSAADGQKRIFGHAAVFFDGTSATENWLFDDYVERIMPGCFDRALRERDDVRALFNHDANMLLGRTSAGTLRLRTDSRGLFYEIDLGNTTAARDVLEHLERGDLTGSSFSFIPDGERVTQEMRDGQKIFVVEVQSVRPLLDVGPVTFPAYTATTAGANRGQAAAAGLCPDVVKARARVIEIEALEKPEKGGHMSSREQEIVRLKQKQAAVAREIAKGRRAASIRRATLRPGHSAAH